MILIITCKRDGHIEAVTRHLDNNATSWIRLNTEDFATNVEITVNPVTGIGSIFLRDSGKRLDPQQVRAVWYRKPEPISLTHFEMDRAALDYIEGEFTEILHGLYALLSHVLWINNPFTTRIAHRKMLQLQIAAKVGFRTPRSLVTNNTETALAFAREIGADLAIKSLGALNVTQESGGQMVQYGIFTRKISNTELEECRDKVRHMPTLYQEFVEKRCELRITCVGKHVFACRIESRQNDLTSDDYRFDTKNLAHFACECPELHKRLHAYMNAFGLNFGCFDIIISKSDEPVFLECNLNGQWLWVENLTGQPIGKAIAGLLESSMSRCPAEQCYTG
jgi:glutathione synthase/RimK-type ligase-like ATP-grasp enzyme